MFMRIISTGSKQGNCYSLHSENEIILFDCGCDFNKILKGIDYKSSNVVGCLLTHRHVDHVKAFIDLVKYGIQVYANDETADHFETITGERMIGRPEGIPFQVGSFKVTPFYVPHTTRDKDTGVIIPCPNFGYVVRHEEMGKLIYMTDFEYCLYSFKNMKINHLVIECNYCQELVDREESNYRHRLQGHCSLETCKRIIRENMTPSLRTVTLVHLSDKASDEERILREIKEVTGNMVAVNIAKPGLTVELNEFPF